MHRNTNGFLLATALAAAALMAAASPGAFGQRRVVLEKGAGAETATAPYGGPAAGLSYTGRVVFSPDGRQLLVLGVKTNLWDIDTATKVWSVKGGRFGSGDRPDSPGDYPMFSADGKQVGWPTERGMGDWMDGGGPPPPRGVYFEVRDAANGRPLREFRHTRLGVGPLFGPSLDGQTLASAGSDDVVRLWDTGTGKLRATLTLDRGRHPMALGWSPDGKLVALMSSAVQRQTWRGPGGPVIGQRGSVSADFTVRVWDVQKGSERGTFKVGGIPSWITFSPDGKLLAATFGMYYAVAICDLETGKVKQTVRHFPADMGAFTATGEALVSCQCFSTPERPSRLSPRPVVLGRVDLATGKAKVVRRLPWGGEAAFEPLACVAISRDGETVAVPDRGGNVLLLDTSTGKTRRVLQGLSGSLPACIIFSPDGTRVAEGTEDGSVVVWVLTESASAPPETDTPALSPMRTWTSADGNFTVEAQCVRDDGDAVVLRKKSGGEVKVPLDKLSAEDRAYIEQRRLRQPDAPEKHDP